MELGISIENDLEAVYKHTNIVPGYIRVDLVLLHVSDYENSFVEFS